MPSDRYQQLTALPPGRFIAKRLGLPESRPLRRHELGQPALAGPALVGGDGRMGELLTATLAALGAEIRQVEPDEDVKLGALVFDATGIEDSAGLRALYEFFHASIRSLGPSGRAVVLGTPPELASTRPQAVAQRALEGFVRSAAKELRQGATGQLVYVAPGAETNAESTLRFLLSARSAYVSGQVIRIGAGEKTDPEDWEQPLFETRFRAANHEGTLSYPPILAWQSVERNGWVWLYDPLQHATATRQPGAEVEMHQPRCADSDFPKLKLRF